MTIEELREEATSTVEWESTPMIDRPLFVWAYTRGAEPREERIAELEKENAELRDYRLSTLVKEQSEVSKYALNLEHKLEWYDNKLIEAKEIIKELCKYPTFHEEGNLVVLEVTKTQLDKAEAFLKEFDK